MRKAITALALVISGLYFLLPAAQDGWQARAMQSWATTEAVIQDWDTRYSFTVGDRYQVATIDYRYTWEGTEYVGDGLSPVPQRYRQPSSWTILAEREYPIGSTQTVYVNPADPRQSFLQIPQPLEIWLPVGIGLLMLTLGLALAIWQLAD